MATEHDSITDPEIHEPKGASTASAGQLYVADGAGSGDWRYLPHSALYYDAIGTGTTYTTPTAYAVINVVSTGDPNPHDFTHNSLGRLTYTGVNTIDINLVSSITFKHSTGSGQDCFFQIYKNGAAITGSQVVGTADSANYQNVTVIGHLEDVATNDYIEIWLKVASGNIIIHAINMQVIGRL